jgi:CRP/FNR family transcriptional regulator, cyclic AMP receptor protein
VHTPPWPSFISMLPPEEQVVINASGWLKSFRKNENLVLEGHMSTGIYILQSGYVKITSSTTNDRTAMIDIMAAGDLIGEFATIDGGPRSTTVTAATNLISRFIPKDEFVRLREHHRHIASAVDRSMTAKLRLNNCRRTDMIPPEAKVRLCRVLARLADRYGTPCDEGLRIKVPITQEDIASLTGCSTAAVQRAFRFLRDRRIVANGRGPLVITNSRLLHDISDTGVLPGSE